MADTLDDAAYRELRRAAETHREDLVLRLGGEVGLRPGEMVRVRTEDTAAVEDHYFLTVRDTDGPTREAYLPADVEHDLRKYASATDTQPGDPLLEVSPRRIQMLVADVAERAADADPALAETSSRDLRRYFAARLLADGVPLRVVREIGGWERLESLAELAPEVDRRAVRRALSRRETTAPERLRRTIAVAADVGERLASMASVEALERAVCERLAGTDGFRFAWLAEPTGDGLTVRASEGIDAGTVTQRLDQQVETARRVLETGDVHSTAGPDGPVVLVPLVREDGVAAVLAIGTDGPVEGAERDLLAALGAQVGHALAAVERKRLLLADTVTELTFECSDERAPTVALSAALGCTVELSGLVPVGDRSLLYYLSVEGAKADTVLETLDTHERVTETRLIEDYGNGALLEAVVDSAPALALIEQDARVRTLTVADGLATVQAELPGDATVRPVVDAVIDAYPGTRLTAKRETSRPTETETAFRERLSGRLTDRQATVLRAAYHSGYFEWPRDSTAEELAESLGVSSPTLHNHLRKAQLKLLTAFFDESPGERPVEPAASLAAESWDS